MLMTRRALGRRVMDLMGWSTVFALETGTASAELRPIARPAQAAAGRFMGHAEQMRRLALERGDQAYGAVVVHDGRIVGEGVSAVVTNHDPTAHAEMEAIRDACRRLGTGDLSGSVVYSTSRPCRMCETACYWARIGRMVFGADLSDGGPPRYGGC